MNLYTNMSALSRIARHLSAKFAIGCVIACMCLPFLNSAALADKPKEPDQETQSQNPTTDDPSKKGCDCEDKPTDPTNDADAATESGTEGDQNKAGDPVIITTGEFIKQRFDLKALSHGQVFTVVRTYGNQQTFNGPFGVKWDSSLFARANDNAYRTLIYTNGDAPVQFTKNGGQYEEYPDKSLSYTGSQYIYSLGNGVTYYFDSSGRALSKTLRTGHVFRWAYDGTGNLTALQNKDNANIYNLYYDTNIITKVADVVGGKDVVYEYSAGGDLTRATSSCSSCAGRPEERYLYATGHNLVTIKNAMDRPILVNHYDGMGRVTTQDSKPGASWAALASYDYSGYAGLSYKMVDYGGTTHTTYLDSNYKVTKAQVARTTGAIAVDRTYAYVYDVNRQLSRTTTPTARVVETPHAANGRRASYASAIAGPLETYKAYAYGTFGNVSRETDARGNKVDYIYNTSGLMLTRIVRQSDNTVVLSESWDYDSDGHELTHKNGEGEIEAKVYDANGYLTKRTIDPAGLNISESYLVDASGRVTARVDPRGQTWVMLYNGSGKVTKSVDPSGHTELYVYDANHKLITQTEQDAATSPTVTRTTVYLRDDWGNLTRMVAPGGRNTDYLYDGNDHITWQKAPTGEEYVTIYNADDQVQQQLVYDPVATVTITRATYFYDGDKNLVSQTDANGSYVVKLKEYDAQNRLTRSTDALNNYTEYRYDGVDNLTREITFDSGDTAQSGMDYAYDATNRLTASRNLASPAWTGTSNQDMVTSYLYDNANRITKTNTTLYGNDGSETVAERTSTYDAAGRQLTQVQSDGPTISFDYDAAGNVLTQKTDPTDLAITATYAYDSIGRVTRTTQPDAAYQVALYDAFGQTTKSIAYDSSNNRLAVTGQFYDDNLGVVTRAYQISSPASTYTFNDTNDPYRDMVYTAVGRLTKTIDPLSHATTYDYDGLGRRITTTDPAGNKSIPLYDNADRLTTQVRLDYDGTNYSTFKIAYEYDSMDRVTKTIDQGPDGDNTATTDNLATTQWYDALGQVTQSQDPAGQQTAYLFDKFGQLTRTTEDASGVARYTDRAYDRAGRLTRLTGYPVDATNAQNTDYAYNKAGAQTRVTYPDDNPGTSRGYVVYSYDAALRLTRINSQDNTDTDVAYDNMGRKLTLTKGSEIDSLAYAASGVLTLAQRGVTGNLDAISKVDRAYDGLLRLTREAQTVKEGATRNVDYTYDKGANVLTLTYPSGIAIQTSYDSLGRALTVKRDGSQLVNYAYVGYRPKSQTFETGANDVALTITYDGMARLTRMAYSQSGNTSLPDFTYGFDTASDITRKTFNNLPGVPNEDYTYDTLHRLTHTVFGQRSSTPYKGYVYDDLGNHLTQDNNGTTTAGLFNAVNEMTKRGTPGSETDVLYDARGNLTKDDAGKAYFYDRQNMLTRVEDNASSRIVSYAYDALNRRIEKDVATTGVSRFYWTADWQLLEETDDAGTPDVRRYYVWVPGSEGYIDDEIAFVDSTGGSAVTYFPCHNHNFSIVAMLNTSGSVIERYDFNPYGERIVLDPDYANDADGVSDILNPTGFQGLFHDDESGLIYNRYRILNSTLGRWMQRDPLGYVDGMSNCEYVVSNPTRYTDPIGESWKDIAFSSIGRDISGDIPPGRQGFPIGLGGARLQIIWYFTGEYFGCCNSTTGQKEHWAKATLGLEAYVIWGYAGKTKGWTGPGRDRNKRGPDGIKNKKRGPENRPVGGFRERTWHADFSGTKPCPKEWYEGRVYIFVRGSAGAYFGGQVNLQRTWTFGDGVDGSDLEFTVHAAKGIWGISIEIGGGGSFSIQKRVE